MNFIQSRPIPVSQLGVAASTLYTCPAGMRATVKQLSVTNVNAAVRTLTLYRVPSGGAAGATNTIVSGMNIPPTGNLPVSLAPYLANQVLDPGDTIQALASAATSLNVAGGVIEEA